MVLALHMVCRVPITSKAPSALIHIVFHFDITALSK